jgi:hypothetical protein
MGQIEYVRGRFQVAVQRGRTKPGARRRKVKLAKSACVRSRPIGERVIAHGRNAARLAELSTELDGAQWILPTAVTMRHAVAFPHAIADSTKPIS